MEVQIYKNVTSELAENDQEIRSHALAVVAQWIELRPVNQRVAGLIPSLRHMPGLQVRSPVGACERQPYTDASVPLFLPPFPSPKINK